MKIQLCAMALGVLWATVTWGAENTSQPEDGWFLFSPGKDSLDKAVLDLRNLNEPEAGSKGVVIAKGNDVVFEKTGEPARFWGVSVTGGRWGIVKSMTKEQADYLAARLAKVGVNMVRIHAAEFPEEAEMDAYLDKVFYLEAALKKQGIYTGLNWICTASNWPLSDIYIDPEARDKARALVSRFMGTKSPYTGMTLARDPAVAYVEVVDEDSVFWWTFNPKRLTPPVREKLEKNFATWLTSKYGTLEKAKAAWGPADQKTEPEGDDFAAGRVALYATGGLTGNAWAVQQRNPQRASDQTRYLTELEKSQYAEWKKWFQETLGYRSLMAGSNWKTADERVLGPLEQYANLSGDVIARNTYCSSPQILSKGWMLSVGDVYQDMSVLKAPENAIMMHIQWDEKPFMITEGGWTAPNRFRAEDPFLMAGYGNLQGMDALFPFQMQMDWVKKLEIWPICTPVTMGQYPAASLIFRRNYVKEAPAVVTDQLNLSQLYQLKGGSLGQLLGLDFAKAGQAEGAEKMEHAALFDPLSFYVGRVVRKMTEGEPGMRKDPGLAACIDRQGKKVRSITGEMALDYGQGIATMQAPCAQGLSGFLSQAGKVELQDVTIESRNEYGTIMVVSLDGQPLKTSRRVLLQVATEEKNLGYKTEAGSATRGETTLQGNKIVEMGSGPLVVRKFSGDIIFKGVFPRVLALDVYGNLKKELPGGADKVTKVGLLEDTLYYVLER